MDRTAREWRLIVQALRELRTLRDDWDAAGAVAPASDVVDTAIALVETLRDEGYPPPATAVASPAGSILLGWWEGEVYREAEVVSPERVEWMMIRGGHLVEHRTDSPPAVWGTARV